MGQDAFVAKGVTRHYNRLIPFISFLRSTLTIDVSAVHCYLSIRVVYTEISFPDVQLNESETM